MTPFPDMLKTYQKLFEAAVWPVWIADINNQKIIWANHSSLTTLGVNPEKLIGFPLDRILHLRGNEQENRTIRELVIKENHFSAYFDPYKSVESTIDDIIDNNRIFVQPVLSEDYIILYLRPGKSPLLNMMLSSSDRFIMRLDNTSNIEELLPTAYWNRIVPEGSFFKKGVTDLVLPEDWRRFCDGRKIFIQTAAEYRVTNKTPFIPLADDLFAELSSFSQNGNVNTVFYFKKAYDLSNKDYTINCTIESVSDEGFALLFDQKVPFRNRGYQFGLTLLSGMRAWTLKKNTYYVKIAACTESITDPLTISIT
ncbi:MAG: hypothetical protein JNL74_19035, partial [Fibrobacteres bacterium]|nr:hypothetical protein [Fibrobacterota bacterium]